MSRYTLGRRFLDHVHARSCRVPPLGSGIEVAPRCGCPQPPRFYVLGRYLLGWSYRGPLGARTRAI
jgi:hypothetical protein